MVKLSRQDQRWERSQAETFNFFVNGSAYKQQRFPCKRRRCWCTPRRTHTFSAQRAICHTSHLALSPSTRSLLHMFRIRCTTESATARACGSSGRMGDNGLSTIWQQTSESSPTDSSSFFLNGWSSKQGLETLYNGSAFLFANSQYLSTHFWVCPSMSLDHAIVLAWGLSHRGNLTVAPDGHKLVTDDWQD